MSTRPTVTVDTLLGGQVALEQPGPRHGYRFNADSVLLAGFAAAPGGQVNRLVDLGAGVGAVALCVAHLVPVDVAILVDQDSELSRFAERNLARAGVTGNAVIADVATCTQEMVGGPADLVVANPPYRQRAAGRSAKNAKVARAREGDFRPFVSAASRLLTSSDARACLCFPSRALVQLLSCAQSVGLHPRRMSFVHGKLERPARIVLVEMVRDDREIELELTAPIVENPPRRS